MAELIWALAGIAERLNRSKACRVGVLPRIHIVTIPPKLVVGLALST
jgi:hypothetical protein